MRLKCSFAAYLILLVWIVLWKLEPPHLGHPGFGNLKLLPFVSTDTFGGSGSAEVLVNLLLFLPLGAFLGVLARARSTPALLAVSALTSLTLETVQFVFAIGVFDVTDLIVNTAGAALELWGVRALLRDPAESQRMRRYLATWSVVGVSGAWLAAAVFTLLPLHFVQPDVGPLSTRFG